MKIDKNVPIPQTTVRRKYPFDMMEAGDSFLLPPDMDYIKTRGAAQNWGKVNGGKKFAVRKTVDGYRCWRVS